MKKNFSSANNFILGPAKNIKKIGINAKKSLVTQMIYSYIKLKDFTKENKKRKNYLKCRRSPIDYSKDFSRS